MAGALTLGAGVTGSVLKRQLRPTGGEGVTRRVKPLLRAVLRGD